MSKYWAKEDRKAWENSEVFSEFEKTILSNIQKLSSGNYGIGKTAQSNIAQKTEQVKQLTDAVNKANEAIKSSGLASSADDGESEQEDFLMAHTDNPYASNFSQPSFSASKDWEEDDAKDQILDELRTMAYDAAISGNIKLAYQIERTIQEIMDEE